MNMESKLEKSRTMYLPRTRDSILSSFGIEYWYRTFEQKFKNSGRGLSKYVFPYLKFEKVVYLAIVAFHVFKIDDFSMCNRFLLQSNVLVSIRGVPEVDVRIIRAI